jgi:hypothetical protein
MTDLDAVQALLSDAFQRVHELVGGVTDKLSEDLSTFRPDADSNSVGWLVWHLTRIQDDHVADAAGVDQVWPAWRDRFGLPFDDFATGYGQSSADVAAVRVSGDLLAGYHEDVQALTNRYLQRLTLDELERVVDERWDPPVTVSVRLVSVVSDCLQHLGQAAYVRGLAERATARG